MKRLSVLLILCLLLTACAGMTTRHLPKNSWRGQAPQRLEMRYVTFNYSTSLQEDDVLHVSGEAFPDVNRLPDWASWYGEILVSVYLVDSEGRVIAKEETRLPAQALNRESGFPVNAALEPGTSLQQPLFITFGYSLSLLDAKPGEQSRQSVVTEGALEH